MLSLNSGTRKFTLRYQKFVISLRYQQLTVGTTELPQIVQIIRDM